MYITPNGITQSTLPRPGARRHHGGATRRCWRCGRRAGRLARPGLRLPPAHHGAARTSPHPLAVGPAPAYPPPRTPHGQFAGPAQAGQRHVAPPSCHHTANPPPTARALPAAHSTGRGIPAPIPQNPTDPTRPAPAPGRPPHPHSRRRPPPHRPTCDFQAVLQSCRRTTILFRYQNNNALLSRQRQGRADRPRKPFFSQNEVQGLGPWRGAGQRPALPSALISASYKFACPASSVARSIAAIRLVGSARPVPAILNAVPWSGEVRMIGRPSVVFTPWCISSVFSGISAWS